MRLKTAFGRIAARRPAWRFCSKTRHSGGNSWEGRMWIKQLGRTMWAPDDQGQSGGSNTPPAGGQERTFTQAELDAIAATPPP